MAPKKIKVVKKNNSKEIQTLDSAEIKRLRALFNLMNECGVGELEVSKGNEKISIRTSNGMISKENTQIVQQQYSPPPSEVKQVNVPQKPAPATNKDIKEVCSPLVGTFYSSPSPQSEHYVKVGQKIKKGDILCIVEAMKLMNEIESEYSGTLVSILVENGQPIEYGEPLFAIDTSS